MPLQKNGKNAVTSNFRKGFKTDCMNKLILSLIKMHKTTAQNHLGFFIIFLSLRILAFKASEQSRNY